MTRERFDYHIQRILDDGTEDKQAIADFLAELRDSMFGNDSFIEDDDSTDAGE